MESTQLMAVFVAISVISVFFAILSFTKVKDKKWFHWFTVIYTFSGAAFGAGLSILGVSLPFPPSMSVLLTILGLVTYFRIIIYAEQIKQDIAP